MISDSMPQAQMFEGEFNRVLNATGVDPDKSLFELGGTSLTAIRLSAALSKVTGFSIPVSVVLNSPSLNGMRAWLEEHRSLELAAAEEVSEVGLTSLQSAFLLQHLDADDDYQNYSYMAWRISGPLDKDRLIRALGDVHRRHGYLRGHYELGVHATWRPSALPAAIEYLDAQDEESASMRLTEALSAPLSLAEGVVWRAVLCSVRESGTWLLGVTVHHIAFDGWSRGIFAEDLSVAYNPRCAGHEPEFAATAPQPDAVHAELERSRSLADLDAQARYWKRVLSEPPPGQAPWLADSPLPTWGIGVIEIPFTPAQDERLRVAAVGVGLLPPFLAALGASLAELTGATDIGIGVPVSVRSTLVLQQPVACLINMVCVRLRAPGGADARSSATTAVRGALANCDISWSEAARLAGRRPTDATFHVIGAIQDSPGDELRLENCVVSTHRLQPMGLPAPLMAELVVSDGTVPRIRISYEADRVTAHHARAIAEGIMSRLAEANLWQCRMPDIRHQRPLINSTKWHSLLGKLIGKWRQNWVEAREDRPQLSLKRHRDGTGTVVDTRGPGLLQLSSTRRRPPHCPDLRHHCRVTSSRQSSKAILSR